MSWPPRLLPVPDEVTGQPAPPRAPRVVGPWAGHPKRGRRKVSWRPGRRAPFSKRWVMLEFVSAKRCNIIRFLIPRLAGLLAILSPICTLGFLVHASGWRSLTVLGFLEALPAAVAALAIPSAIYCYTVSRREAVYVGSRWINDKYESVGDGNSATILDIYRLTKIEVNQSSRSGATLRIFSGEHKEVESSLGLLEGNPNLWDYVHNGLVHSAVRGAEVDPLTRRLLHLPGPDVAECNSDRSIS